MTIVDLEVIDADNWCDALEVRVADEQVPFVADYQPIALVILAKCFVHPDGRRWEPLLVRSDPSEAVGVLAMAHGPDECELRHVAIDVGRQRRGYGTAAVRAVVERARRSASACTQLVVTAHPDNRAAHHAYRSAGFDWDGEERAGEPVWRCVVDRTSPDA